MPFLKRKLRTLLDNAERVAVLGIGSELRGDDAVGLLVLDHLRKKVGPHSLCGRSDPAGQAVLPPVSVGQGCPTLPPKEKPLLRPVCKLFNGGTAPENLTGEIRRFKPSHLVLIDAVDMGKKPGTMEILDPRVTANISFFTHKLPIRLMLDFLAGEMKITAFLIAIQPRNLDFAAPVSSAVEKAGKLAADCLSAALEGRF